MKDIVYHMQYYVYISRTRFAQRFNCLQKGSSYLKILKFQTFFKIAYFFPKKKLVQIRTAAFAKHNLFFLYSQQKAIKSNSNDAIFHYFQQPPYLYCSCKLDTTMTFCDVYLAVLFLLWNDTSHIDSFKQLLRITSVLMAMIDSIITIYIQKWIHSKFGATWCRHKIVCIKLMQIA